MSWEHGDVDEDGDEIVVCLECDGSGKAPEECDACAGTGMIDNDDEEYVCDQCLGTGNIDVGCEICCGFGRMDW